jgi:hypothetical protein
MAVRLRVRTTTPEQVWFSAPPLTLICGVSPGCFLRKSLLRICSLPLLSRVPLHLGSPTYTFQTPESPRSFAGNFLRLRHNHLDRRMFAPRSDSRKRVPHPPPKFAVFRKKFAGNATLKVRPIQSPAAYVDENVTAEWSTTHPES